MPIKYSGFRHARRCRCPDTRNEMAFARLTATISSMRQQVRTEIARTHNNRQATVPNTDLRQVGEVAPRSDAEPPNDFNSTTSTGNSERDFESSERGAASKADLNTFTRNR